MEIRVFIYPFLCHPFYIILVDMAVLIHVAMFILTFYSEINL